MEQFKLLFYRLTHGYTVLPVYLAVNVINVCNRSCRFCPYHSPDLAENQHTRWFRAQPELMSMTNYIDLMYKIRPYRRWIKHVALTGKGEPLMHPKIMAMCEGLNLIGIPFSVTTNGDYLKVSDEAMLANMPSFTGLRVSVYEAGMMSYWKERARRSAIDMQLYNQTGQHFPGMKDGYTVWIEGNRVHSMPKDFNDRPCRSPWSFLTVNTDGSIVPCYSYHQTATIHDSAWVIYNGKAIREYRRRALRLDAPDADCKNCGVNLREEEQI